MQKSAAQRNIISTAAASACFAHILPAKAGCFMCPISVHPYTVHSTGSNITSCAIGLIDFKIDGPYFASLDFFKASTECLSSSTIRLTCANLLFGVDGGGGGGGGGGGRRDRGFRGEGRRFLVAC